jgi:hypothetical protein
VKHQGVCFSFKNSVFRTAVGSLDPLPFDKRNIVLCLSEKAIVVHEEPFHAVTLRPPLKVSRHEFNFW